MQNLVEKISKRTGMDNEKPIEALLAVSEHVKAEFPLLHSVVDKILGTQGLPATENEHAANEFPKREIMYN